VTAAETSSGAPGSATAARSDVLWAAAAGAIALAVYVRTLAPGLVATVDTPMFQFIGRVLGVPHNPGYPLYVLLTHPVSLLPVGSLAYRINFFSAVLGALAVSLTFLVARRLGCRTAIGLAAALGLAFGQVFWSQAVIAEVYTLHTALIAGVLLALLAWRQTRRARFFYAAIAAFAAGLGNHTTILAFAPGIVLYALLTDHRFFLRWRTLLLTITILAAGILQYAFILIRSRHPGAYLESRATTIPELVDVILARQFRDRLFAFDLQKVVSDRFPQMIEHVLVAELTAVGLVLATAGAAWLLRRRFTEGVLLLSGFCLVLGFALNYRVVDTHVFAIPAILVLWLTAAVGTERLARFADRWTWSGVACGLAALTLPAWNLTHNLAANDRSRDTKAAVHFDALFRALPARAFLVHEDFLVDRMVTFKSFVDGRAAGRRVSLAPRDANVLRQRLGAGSAVFAFGKSARRLRHDALNFSFEPLPLIDGRLPQFLHGLEDGMVVAVAVPSVYAERFFAGGAASFTAIGGPGELSRREASNVAIAGVRGRPNGALVRLDASDIQIDVVADQEIAGTGVAAPSAFQIRASRGEAAIRQGARDIVRSADGAAVAVWNPDGRLAHAYVLQASQDFRVPVPAGPLSVYRLREAWTSQDLPVGDWTDVTRALRTGSVMVRVQPGSGVLLYVGDDAPLAPRVVDRSSDRMRLEVTPFAQGSESLRAQLTTDAASGGELASAPYVYRIEMNASGSRPMSALVALGGVPTTAIGRMTRSGSPNPGTLFSVETKGLLRSPDDSSEVLLLARDEQAQLTGHGWSAVDWDSVSPYRWMTTPEARLVLPIAKGSPRRIRIQALLDAAGVPSTVRLRLNGTMLPEKSLSAGWFPYEWTLPAGALAPGTNEVTVIVDKLPVPAKGDDAPRDLAVTEVRVIHGSSPK
jgi:hypothetical protein